jgi:hypothetical protein
MVVARVHTVYVMDQQHHAGDHDHQEAHDHELQALLFVSNQSLIVLSGTRYKRNLSNKTL